MNSINFLDELQQQFYETFESQDPELLDTVFDVEEKKLYADKLRLSLVSSTFKSMLSDLWNSSKGDSVKITSYKFDDFKEFLTFIYSGKCNIIDGNVFDLLDMAEFYQIHHLKCLCGRYMLKMKIDFQNVFQLLEISVKYSISQMKEPIELFISDNFVNFLKCEKYINADEALIEDSLDEIIYNVIQRKPEETFQAIYEWRENEIVEAQKSDEKNFNKNDAVKNELAPFLSYFPFMKMKRTFLRNFIVDKNFLFSSNEFKELLKYVNLAGKVIITNSDGQTMSGYLSPDSDVIEILYALKKRYSDHSGYNIIFWKTACEIPSTPSPLKKRDGVEWYLVYFYNGVIGVARSSHVINRHYILAEMTTKIHFEVTQCEVDVV